ncbi:MAG: ATP-binding protein [Sedimentisphaerales bacterium]|nr:ATP-binding protein [Sedimentisphaerales bacterium]
MRELSLHILDLVENSIRAEASIVCIEIMADNAADLLHVSVEDNGPGFGVPVETAFDPFYTTKEGKKMGLGLSLFRGTIERADGDVWAGTSERFGGAAIRATMQLRHVDRSPLGNLARSMAGVVCTNPEIDFRVSFDLDGQKYFLSSASLLEESGYDSLEAAEKVYEWVAAILRNCAVL